MIESNKRLPSLIEELIQDVAKPNENPFLSSFTTDESPFISPFTANENPFTSPLTTADNPTEIIVDSPIVVIPRPINETIPTGIVKGEPIGLELPPDNSIPPFEDEPIQEDEPAQTQTNNTKNNMWFWLLIIVGGAYVFSKKK